MAIRTTILPSTFYVGQFTSTKPIAKHNFPPRRNNLMLTLADFESGCSGPNEPSGKISTP
jgi:hypothetical protein